VSALDHYFHVTCREPPILGRGTLSPRELACARYVRIAASVVANQPPGGRDASTSCSIANFRLRITPWIVNRMRGVRMAKTLDRRRVTVSMGKDIFFAFSSFRAFVLESVSFSFRRRLRKASTRSQASFTEGED
jgi:hypothetical protein